MLNLSKVELRISAGFTSQFPGDPVPQIAFSGRSNVGKSSLINTLLGRKSLARVSSAPGKTVTVYDEAAYGFITLEGHGKMEAFDIETPTLIRYGELTNDEFFVSEKKAKAGVTITNTSSCEPIVILKHFAENPELDRFMKG